MADLIKTLNGKYMLTAYQGVCHNYLQLRILFYIKNVNWEYSFTDFRDKKAIKK